MQMNQFGNRGFGGPPQPQRQGGRRGNRGGGGGGGNFRGNSRFEHNQPRNQNYQQGGQRPNNEPAKPAQQQAAKPPQQASPAVQAAKPAQTPSPAAAQKTTPQKIDTPPAQQPKPQQQQNQQKTPQQQNQQKTPQQQNQQNTPQQQNKPPQQQNKPQQQQNKPPQQQQQQPKPAPAPLAKSQSMDNVDKAAPEQKNAPRNQNDQRNQNQLQNANMNGSFGGPKQGGWASAGGQGKQGGMGQKRGGGPGGPSGAGPRQSQQFSGPAGQGHFGGPHGPGGPRGQMRGRGPPPEEQMLAMKLQDLVGPLLDLPPIDQSEVKFNGRSRLYIGNLTNDVTEEEIYKMFNQFGEAAELFLNKEKNFGFIKMDYRVNAERAKRELDGTMRNTRPLRVRFAPHNSAIRVKNLPPFVSNELLYRAFEIFGKIERAYVKVDERGKTLGEGVVEYVRKPSALAAIRNCTEKCFFLTSSLRPVIVESFEEPDELDGYPEKNLPKKHPDYYKAREVGPRFSELNSFEHEYGTRWKQLHELHRQKEEALKKELAAEEEKLEAQMEYAKYEHETELLREQLRQREQDRERQKRSWEMAERAAEERRESERALLLRQEEELSQRMRNQDDELRRRQQENTLFVQAQRLNSMLDRQEQGMFDQQKPVDGGFRDQYDGGRGGFDDMQSRWETGTGRSMDDFPNKRRRF